MSTTGFARDIGMRQFTNLILLALVAATAIVLLNPDAVPLAVVPGTGISRAG